MHAIPPCWVSLSMLDVAYCSSCISVRLGHSATSTSRPFDSKLKRLAAETGGKGGEEQEHELTFGQTIQARLHPTWPAFRHAIHRPSDTKRPHTVKGASGAQKG